MDQIHVRQVQAIEVLANYFCYLFSTKNLAMELCEMSVRHSKFQSGFHLEPTCRMWLY